MLPTLRAHQLGEPDRPSRDLTFPVATLAPSWAIHEPSPVASRLREPDHQQARAVNTAYRLRTQRATTQNAFDRFRSPLRASELPNQTYYRLRNGNSSTTFTDHPGPPGQGLGPSWAASPGSHRTLRV